MAAANWDQSPGAGSKEKGMDKAGNKADAKGADKANAKANANAKADTPYASSLRALQDLADALPGFRRRLESRDDLEARQQALVQAGGSIEQTGLGAEQVRLRISERVGEGTFCVVYRGELVPTTAGGEAKAVAAKFELRKTDSTQLRNEFRMYKKFSNEPGIANIYCFGELGFHKVLVMDLLGPSLEHYFQQCGRRFSVKTVCMLAKQMISRVQTIHEHDLIYRDIKPENFLMGRPGSADANLVHLIDYGMAKPFRDADTSKHIAYGEAKSLSGTARYMSINAHRRCTQSRRDDVEALGHVLLYFLRGSLPWQGTTKVPANEPPELHDQRYDQMCDKKQATSIADLCHACPPALAAYMTYARGLAFDAEPDYAFLRGLFAGVMRDQGLVDDGVYDWQKVATATAPTAPPTSTTTTSSATTPPQPILPRTVTTADDSSRGIAPGSPPGAKRGRAEFVSELQPPTRSRPKKPKPTYYDSVAQTALSSLCRDIMAKRYAFHRAVKQSRTGPHAAIAIAQAASAATAATSAARAASAAMLARGHGLSSAAAPAAPAYQGPMVSLRSVGPTVIAQAFMDSLDKTLSLVIRELEDMGDRLLRNGDWSGAVRVQAWIGEVEEAVRQEMERLRAAEKAVEKVVDRPATPQDIAETSPPPMAPLQVTQAQIDQIDPVDASLPAALEVDTAPDVGISKLTGMSLRDQFGGRRGIGYSPRDVVAPSAPVVADLLPTVEPTTTTTTTTTATADRPTSAGLATPPATLSRDSPSAAVRAGIHDLTLAAAAAAAADKSMAVDAIEVDQGDADDDNEMMELVYRTATGVRKVMRVPRGG